MIDLNVQEFPSHVYQDFDFDLCRGALIDFYLLVKNHDQSRHSVGLKHSGISEDWISQAQDGSYGSHLRYGSLMPETTPLLSVFDDVKDPGIFSMWNSKFQELYPKVTAEFDRVAPDLRRPKLAGIAAGKCLPMHVDLARSRAYHLCVVSNPQTFFVMGDRFLRMLPGRWYEFDPNTPHTVVNLGPTDILHVLARDPDPVTPQDLIFCQSQELEIIRDFFHSFTEPRQIMLQRERVQAVVTYYVRHCQRHGIAADLLSINHLILDFAQAHDLVPGAPTCIKS